MKNFYENKILKLMWGVRKKGQDPLEFLLKSFNYWTERDSLQTFTIKEITTLETFRLISKLGNLTAFGRDGLDAMSIKVATEHLAPQIRHLINLSIQNKEYIMKWKLPWVISILKTKEASQQEPASYRPISLLPVISKLVERSVQSKFQIHLETNGLLHPNSHAYRENQSTSTAMMQIMDSIYQTTDKNMMTSLMVLDQSTAFDCVNHNILLRKLELYGCDKNTLTWMKEYLQNR